MKLSAIVAMTPDRVIGRGGDLPWHLPEDLKFFKRTTSSHPIVMGRKTYDSIGRPLPKRRNIVLTRQPGWQAEGAETVTSLPAALALAADPPPDSGRVCVIGGAELYAAALPLADELALTEIDRDFAGDARFPAWRRADFEEVERERMTPAQPNDFPLAFVRYRRTR